MVDYKKYIVVKNSVIHGTGLFTSINIPVDEIIMEIDGESIDGNECERREEEENNVYIFYNEEDHYIDSAKTTKIKYINHGCDYNCDVENDENGRLVIKSVREIKAGEELTIDYGYEEIYVNCACFKCYENKKPTV